MTYDELLALLNVKSDSDQIHALRAVVELHKPDNEGYCEMNCVDKDDDGYSWTMVSYPCLTVQAIAKELEA